MNRSCKIGNAVRELSLVKSNEVAKLIYFSCDCCEGTEIRLAILFQLQPAKFNFLKKIIHFSMLTGPTKAEQYSPFGDRRII